MQNVNERIYAILKSILEVPINEQTSISMQNCEQWTSLAHIDIIMSIEEEFGIAFGADDLPDLNTQEALIDKVKELL
ncbi:acyl carrier protein [uncultured Helicobacter sp.]|uniref:acyl carrier protein n=1 Tax=uncultured Helicobacter sp. TaxID=175537 RepID=UPI0025CFC5AF|nr:acyl carrier protein [uncultured Helicobacter sp.]